MFSPKQPRLGRDDAAQLQTLTGISSPPLVIAVGDDATVALMREYMAVRYGTGWVAMRWVDILRGGWNEERDQLYWTLNDGSQGAITLAAPGQVPAVFAERVRASIVIQRYVDLPDDAGAARVVGRRQPGTDDPISWQVEPIAGIDLSDPLVQKFIIEFTNQLKREFSDGPAE